MNQKPALIVLNGDHFDYSQLKDIQSEFDCIIACDGASKHLREYDILPNIVIGDFDSSHYPGKKIQNNIKYIKYPRDKDFTDSELAFDYAKSIGYRTLVVVGLNGSRTDHLLVNVFLAAKRKYSVLHIEYRDFDQVIHVVRGQFIISGIKGDTISFLPIFGPARIVACDGLKYDLTKYDLSMNGNQGISNVLTKKKAILYLMSGKLLVVHQKNGSKT